jgi:hypothetical protein
VNGTDRRVLGGMYRCLNAMGGLPPSNPADIAATSRAARVGGECAGMLAGALEFLAGGETEAALEEVEAAARLLQVDVRGAALPPPPQ